MPMVLLVSALSCRIKHVTLRCFCYCFSGFIFPPRNSESFNQSCGVHSNSLQTNVRWADVIKENNLSPHWSPASSLLQEWHVKKPKIISFLPRGTHTHAWPSSMIWGSSRLGLIWALQGTFGNVRRHFWLLELRGRDCYWHLVDRGQGCGKHLTMHRTACTT